MTRDTLYRQTECRLGTIKCDPQSGTKTRDELSGYFRRMGADAYVSLTGGDITAIIPAARGGDIVETWVVADGR